MRKGKRQKLRGGRVTIFSAVVFFVFALSVLSVYSGEVAAVHGRIWPATIILRPAVTIYEANTASSYFEITNLDSAAAEVFIEPNNNLNDYVDVNTPYVYLEPGDMENVTFEIAVSDALSHTGDIFVTFKDPAISYTYFVNLKIYPSPAGYATNTKAPSVPTGLTPSKHYCAQGVTVSWTAAADADTSTVVYEYELDNNNDFSSKLDDGIVVGTEKAFHLDPGLYFWRIRAYDGKYYSPWVMSSFKINKPLECMGTIAELEARIVELESRFNPLEALVNAIKAAVCTLGDFSFCGTGPLNCAGTDTECGLAGVCQNCNLLDGCYSGHYRNYYCSAQSCAYTSSCTEACCDLLHGDPDAYCQAGACHAPPGGCTDECTSGQKRCSGDNRQTCADHDADGCTEWGGDILCPNGCLSGECKPACKAAGAECSAGGECCSGNCAFVRTCVSYDLRGICNRYTYKWACQ